MLNFNSIKRTFHSIPFHFVSFQNIKSTWSETQEQTLIESVYFSLYSKHASLALLAFQTTKTTLLK